MLPFIGTIYIYSNSADFEDKIMKFEKKFRLLSIFPQLQSDTNTCVMENKGSPQLLMKVSNFVYEELEKLEDKEINIPLSYYADYEIPSGKTGREAVIDVIAKIIVNDALDFIGITEKTRLPEYQYRESDRSKVLAKVRRAGLVVDQNSDCGGACAI